MSVMIRRKGAVFIKSKAQKSKRCEIPRGVVGLCAGPERHQRAQGPRHQETRRTRVGGPNGAVPRLSPYPT